MSNGSASDDSILAVVETSFDGMPMVLVINAGLDQFGERDAFSWRLSIILEASSIAENGMPTPVERELLDRVSDELQRAIVTAGRALFFSRSTWNGERQLLFRIQDPSLIVDLLETLCSTHNKRAWSYQIEHDPAWEADAHYLHMVRACEEKGSEEKGSEEKGRE